MIVELAAILFTIGTGGSAPDDQAQRQRLADPNRMICKDIKITGSRLGRQRVCMTAAQWDDERRETRQGVERLQVRGRREGD